MKEQTITDMSRARLYVTTRKSYDGGNRFGEWMDICRYTGREAFIFAFRQMYPQEKDPVLLILDWQDVPGCLVSKAGVSSKIFRLAGYVSTLDAQRNRAFHLWMEHPPARLSTLGSRALIRMFEYTYQGCFPAKGTFGRYYAEEILAIHSTEFDYAGFEEQLFADRFIRIGKYVFSRQTENK